ncbi:hypothetical protein [Sphingomonas jatrophae]|uniref:hypothetical protein n=1 Tax=Sphingomonas jatrophae TaxID=1166337 RepID=UPI001042369A|nr:hypothetical protein [Sphingomonas jatrophae]
MPSLPNGVRLELVEQFEAIANRKRKTGQFTPVEIVLFREDAEWFAAKVSGGMFGGGSRRFLPATVRTFCERCALAKSKKRGVKRWHGRDLANAIDAQADANDPRFLKRLRKRQRDERAAQEFFAEFRALVHQRASRQNLP